MTNIHSGLHVGPMRRRGAGVTATPGILAGALARGWRFLASMRLALALLLALAALTLVGTIVQQIPPSFAASPTARAFWLAQAHSRYGPLTSAMDRLWLFDIFHSLVFRGCMAVLALSITACTSRRWRPLMRTTFRSPIRPGDAFLLHSASAVELATSLPPGIAVERLERCFRKLHYRLRTEATETGITMVADRNRFSVFGTFAVHLSLLLILGGAIAGGI